MSTNAAFARLGRPRGLTLVELIVVIALFAIIVAFAAPSFNDMIARQRVRGISAELMTDLQYARSEAVQRRSPVKVKFGNGAGFTCYTVYLADAECNCQQPVRCPPGATELKWVSVPDSTTVTVSANGPVVFDSARGGTADANAFIATVASTRGLVMQTRVTQVGRVDACSSGHVPVPGVAPCE